MTELEGRFRIEELEEGFSSIKMLVTVVMNVTLSNYQAASEYKWKMFINWLR